jgi:hypothetical protein
MNEFIAWFGGWDLLRMMLIQDCITLGLVYGYIQVNANQHYQQIRKKKWGVLHREEAMEHGAVLLIMSIVKHMPVILMDTWLLSLQAGIYTLFLLSYYWIFFDITINKKLDKPWNYNPVKHLLIIRTWKEVPAWARALKKRELVSLTTEEHGEDADDWNNYRFMKRSYDTRNKIWVYEFIPAYTSILDWYRYKLGAFEIIFKVFLVLLMYFLYIVSFNIY